MGPILLIHLRRLVQRPMPDQGSWFSRLLQITYFYYQITMAEGASFPKERRYSRSEPLERLWVPPTRVIMSVIPISRILRAENPNFRMHERRPIRRVCAALTNSFSMTLKKPNYQAPRWMSDFRRLRGNLSPSQIRQLPSAMRLGLSRNSVLLSAACEHRLGRHHPAAPSHPDSCTETTA